MTRNEVTLAISYHRYSTLTPCLNSV